MIEKEESVNQIVTKNMENDQQISSYNDASVMARQFLDNQFQNQPRDMKELNKNLLIEVYQISKESEQNLENQQISKQILTYFRKTDSIQDTLYNVSILLPRLNQLKQDYEYKSLFAKMKENCNTLHETNIELEYLFRDIQGSMGNYKQKLNFLCSQLDQQHDTKTDLGAFIGKYCVVFETEFKRVSDQEDLIQKIMERIKAIRMQKEMVQLKEINQQQLEFDLLKVFSMNNSKVQQSLEQLHQAWLQTIKQSEEQYQDCKKGVDLLTNQIGVNQRKLKEKINEKEVEQKYLTELQENLDLKRKGNMTIDIDKMERDIIEVMESRRIKANDELQKTHSQNQMKHEKWEADLLNRIEQASKMSESYNFVILMDDSGSMHWKQQRGLWKYFQKTPYEILCDSIKQFIKSRTQISKGKDVISLIKFSDRAYTLCKRDQIGKVKVDFDKNPLKGGTDFNVAFKEAAEIIKIQQQGISTVLIFQTDGQSGLKDECKMYIQQMRQQDPNFRMFTLALGEDIDEAFLRDLTRFANSNQEVMNQGKKNPTAFYSKALDSDQMSRIFEDISLCVDENLQDLHASIRMNQNLLDQEEQRYKSEIFRIQQEYENEKQEQEQKIKQIKGIQDRKSQETFLSQQIREQTEKIKCLDECIQKLNETLQQQKSEQSKQTSILQIKKQDRDTILENSKKEIDLNRERMKVEAKSDAQYIEDKIKIFNQIGEKSEVNLMLWAKSINAFDRYLEIISLLVKKIESFFNKFKNISNDLKEKIDASSSTQNNDIRFETQEQIILDHFKLYNLENTEQILTFISSQLYRGGKDGIVDEALTIILNEYKNIQMFLQGISFNNPKTIKDQRKKLKEEKKKDESDDDDDSEDEDDDQNPNSIKKLIKKINEERQDQLSELEHQAYEIAKKFIDLKVFKKGQLKKVTTTKKCLAIIEKISDFDFPEDEESESSSSDEDDKDDDDDDDNDDDEDDNKKLKGKDGSQKKKSSNMKKETDKKKSGSNKMKKKKKVIILSEDEVKQMKKDLKKVLQEKIEFIKSNKKLIEQVQKLYEFMETRIEQILHAYTKSKKSQQMKIIRTYIQEEILQQLDELLNYFKVSDGK